MKTQDYILVVTVMLTLLFFFTGVEKIWYHPVFHIQLYKQPLAGWIKAALNWGLPISELAAVGFLVYPRTLRWGLWLSAALLLAFTGYTAYAAMEPGGYPVCACGKLFSGLSWTVHIGVNAGFTALAMTAAILHNRHLKQKSVYGRWA